MALDLSPAAQRFVASPTLAINERVLQLKAEGRTIYHMGFGESRFPVHPKVLKALREHATERSYPPVAGLPELRSAIADFYAQEFDLEATPQQIIVGPGSKSVLFALVLTLAGDVVLPRPSWVSYEPQAQIADKHIIWIDTHIDDEYCLTAERLAAGLAEARQAGHQPRILILNSPSNPTGVAYPVDVLEELAQVARDNDLTVLSDEVYALVNHGERPHVSIAKYYPQGTAVTGGLSKHLSLGGWRFGLGVLPAGETGDQVMRVLRAIAGAVWSSPTAPVQHAATVAYSGDPEIMAYIRTCAGIHTAVTRALYDQLQEAGIPCPAPSGAFYLYPNFNPWRTTLRQNHDVSTSNDLATLLLDEYGIAALPGAAFGARPDALALRLSSSYLYTKDDAQAEAALAAYANAPSAADFVHDACPDALEVGRRFREFVATSETN